MSSNVLRFASKNVSISLIVLVSMCRNVNSLSIPDTFMISTKHPGSLSPRAYSTFFKGILFALSEKFTLNNYPMYLKKTQSLIRKLIDTHHFFNISGALKWTCGILISLSNVKCHSNDRNMYVCQYSRFILTIFSKYSQNILRILHLFFHSWIILQYSQILPIFSNSLNILTFSQYSSLILIFREYSSIILLFFWLLSP